MSAITIATTSIRNALVADSTLATKITDAGSGAVKVLRQHAPSYISYPYVVIYHVSGGMTNTTHKNTIDLLMGVAVVSNQMPVAEDISTDIDRVLRDVRITSSSSEWFIYAPLRHIVSVDDVVDIQNTFVYRFGAEYRIRMVEV